MLTLFTLFGRRINPADDRRDVRHASVSNESNRLVRTIYPAHILRFYALLVRTPLTVWSAWAARTYRKSASPAPSSHWGRRTLIRDAGTRDFLNIHLYTS